MRALRHPPSERLFVLHFLPSPDNPLEARILGGPHPHVHRAFTVIHLDRPLFNERKVRRHFVQRLGDGEKKCYSEKELKEFTKKIDELVKNPPTQKVEIVPIDPNTLSGNLVQRIQHIMNKYNGVYNVGKNINEDGKWGPNTDGLWEKFLNHVFGNHTVFKTLAYAKTYQSGMYQ